MDKKEKDILKALVDHHEGELSPAEFINGIAKGDNRSVRNLKSKGYIDTINHQNKDFNGNYYDIPFYYATHKGLVKFESWYKRILFSFKNNIPLYVGISSIVLGIITIIVSSRISLRALDISQDSNNRADTEFKFRMRPFVFVDSVDTVFNTDNKFTQYTFHLKNVGMLPAKLIEKSVNCINEEKIPDKKGFTGKSTVIGSDQTILDELKIMVNKAECEYEFKYKVAIDDFSDINYETSYKFLHEFGQTPGIESSELK